MLNYLEIDQNKYIIGQNVHILYRIGSKCVQNHTILYVIFII